MGLVRIFHTARYHDRPRMSRAGVSESLRLRGPDILKQDDERAQVQSGRAGSRTSIAGTFRATRDIWERITVGGIVPTNTHRVRVHRTRPALFSFSVQLQCRIPSIALAEGEDDKPERWIGPAYTSSQGPMVSICWARYRRSFRH